MELTQDSKSQKRKINDYLSSQEVKKLHIGCGENLLKGWLNTDLVPNCIEVLSMDATQDFPFKEKSFDYLYTEHMIEHISYNQGYLLLLECFRVLKTGGKLRVSTPDLKFLIDLYREDKTKNQIEFIKDSLDRWIKTSPLYFGAPNLNEVFVINNYMRAWEHKFIYDDNVLSALLSKVGFVKIHRVSALESRDPNLRNLENVARKPPGLIALESLIIDCEKPI